ncbi:MAG: hypothetical protein ACJ8F7_20965 [Gemmataceae bacterium]
MSTFWEDRLREFQHGAAHPVRPADRLYPLAHQWSDFFAGTCRGEQALIGPYGASLVACFFGHTGDLLRVEERLQCQAKPAPDRERDAMYLEIMQHAAQNPRDPPVRALEALVWFNRPMRQAWDWARELGTEFGTVRVRRFAVPDKLIGIEDGNRLAEEGIWEDSCDSAEEWLRKWLGGGSFVFWWGRDLWVDGEGKIFAT